MGGKSPLGFDIPETFLSPKIRRLFDIASTAINDVKFCEYFVEGQATKTSENEPNRLMQLPQHETYDIPIPSFGALNDLFVTRGLLPCPPHNDAVDESFEDSAAKSESRFEETLEVLAPVIVETAKRWHCLDRNRDEWRDQSLEILR